MTEKDGSALLESVCEDGNLLLVTEQYINSCNQSDSDSKEENNGARKEKQRKKSGRFPNVAGFCRYIGIGQSEYARLSKKYPEEFEKLSCVLEDEALNSEISPTLLGAYLKKRLGYDDSARTQKNDVDVGQLKLIFEHDIIADGE